MPHRQAEWPSRWDAAKAASGEVFEGRDDLDLPQTAAGGLTLGGMSFDPHLRPVSRPTERPMPHGQGVRQVVGGIGPIHFDDDDVDVGTIARNEVALQSSNNHQHAYLLEAATRCVRLI